MLARLTLLTGALICVLFPFNLGAQGSCNCPDGEVEIQIEWLQSTTTNPGGESWELVNQDGVMLVSGGPYFNSAECIPAQDILTVYGYDSDGSGWSGSSLRFQTQLGSTFNTFSPSGSFGSETFVPEIDGYITPLSGTCVYEIRDEFGNTVWHSGYSGNCSQKQCQIPAGQFELFTYAGTSMAIQLEKIVGFAPGQGVIYNGTFDIPSPGFCNGCARSGLLPTCNCGILDSDSDLICDNLDDCIGEVDECGICQGTGIPEGFCDCFGNQPDAIGVCGGDCATDQDEDGICDDVDDCIGQYDECGICNGSGIPAGDCDCLGNAFDAVGVCGGNCTADADNDLICDDVDDCVGELDACGICNGPGPIYACGCEAIPEGDCDCNGNQEDAIGVCGGSCTSDNNGDGICDDVIYGCMDPDACTFNPNATLPNETCLYIDECGECGGNNTCVGCLEPAACNYNSSATISSADCDYCSCYSLPSIGVLQWGLATLSQGELSTTGFWTENNMILPPTTRH